MVEDKERRKREREKRECVWKCKTRYPGGEGGVEVKSGMYGEVR